MVQQNGMEDDCIMKHLSQNTFVVILGISLCISCSPLKKDGRVMKYPEEIKLTSDIARIIQTNVPTYSSVIDICSMKVYSLGEYYLMQSILFGPSGRASNYHHYLITDNTYSKQVYFMSLSSEINNIWIDGDTLFVDLLDFIDEAYSNNGYTNCDKCDFVLYNMKLSASSFVLDTITKKTVGLGWEELKTFSTH